MSAYPEIIPFCVYIADAATVDENRYYAPPVPSGAVYKLQDASFIPDTAVAQDAAEYRTITLSDGTTTFGTLTTVTVTGVALTEGTPSAFTLSGACEIKVGTTVLKIASVHTGSTGKVAQGRLVGTLVRVGA